jgi:hypothetical protein
MSIDVKEIVDKYANGAARKEFENYLKKELYPDAFQGEYTWLHIKELLAAHDAYIKRYITESLEELLKK